jgi:hypothetical protein
MIGKSRTRLHGVHGEAICGLDGIAWAEGKGRAIGRAVYAPATIRYGRIDAADEAA